MFQLGTEGIPGDNTVVALVLAWNYTVIKFFCRICKVFFFPFDMKYKYRSQDNQKKGFRVMFNICKVVENSK